MDQGSGISRTHEVDCVAQVRLALRGRAHLCGELVRPPLEVEDIEVKGHAIRVVCGGMTDRPCWRCHRRITWTRAPCRATASVRGSSRGGGRRASRSGPCRCVPGGAERGLADDGGYVSPMCIEAGDRLRRRSAHEMQRLLSERSQVRVLPGAHRRTAGQIETTPLTCCFVILARMSSCVVSCRPGVKSPLRIACQQCRRRRSMGILCRSWGSGAAWNLVATPASS
jgi:hypothetical protein